MSNDSGACKVMLEKANVLRFLKFSLHTEAEKLGVEIDERLVDAVSERLSPLAINNIKAINMLSSVADELFAAISRLNRYEAAEVSCDSLSPPELTDMETVHIIRKFLSEL